MGVLEPRNPLFQEMGFEPLSGSGESQGFGVQLDAFRSFSLASIVQAVAVSDEMVH